MAGVVRVEDSDGGDGDWGSGVEGDLGGCQSGNRPSLHTIFSPAHFDELPPSRGQNGRDHSLPSPALRLP